MKILVTGGAGFVMSHVVKTWLQSHADARAVVIDVFDLEPPSRLFFDGINHRIDWISGSVSEREVWQNLLGHQDITHVVHGAAVTSIVSRLGDYPDVARQTDYIQSAMATNVLGTARALGFAAMLPSLKRFINVSSGSVYGLDAPEGAVPEDGFVEPRGFYAVSKFCGELLIDSYIDQFGLDAASVRLSGVYGPMDRPTPGRDVRCVPQLIAHGARAGQRLRVNSLIAKGDFIHAEDVARGIVALLDSGRLNHQVYNIAHGEHTSVAQLLEITREYYPGVAWDEVGDARPDIQLDPGLDRGRFGYYSIDRITLDVGWYPRSINTAMKDYLQWMDNHPY